MNVLRPSSSPDRWDLTSLQKTAMLTALTPIYSLILRVKFKGLSLRFAFSLIATIRLNIWAQSSKNVYSPVAAIPQADQSATHKRLLQASPYLEE